MTKITDNFYRTKSKGTFSGLSKLFLLVLMPFQVSWGQQPISTGQFDGGFENATLHASALTQTTPHVSNWAFDSSNLSTSSIVSVATNVRSGSKGIYFNHIGTSTGKYIMSPILIPALVGGNGITAGPSYTVQYYVKQATANSIKGAIYVSTRGSGAGTQASADANGWQKVTYRYTGATALASVNTWVGFGNNLAQNLSGYVDDLVVYLGTDDNLIPDPPTDPVLSGLNLSWTAPVSGVDQGGYVVVRYSSNPNADNDPNMNGIYGVNNTITNGAGSLAGTVVYIGAGTSFTDSVIGSVSGSDYYKIYTVDKAFNYSSELIATNVVPTSTTWNGVTWSDGVPSLAIDAVINGAYNTNIGGNQGPFMSKKLTITSLGSLIINSGTSVTVLNEVVNSGGLIVENNANLIQTNDVPNTGNILVKRNSNPLYRFDYTLWSSPVANQNLVAFSPLTSQSPSRFYTYNSVTNLYNAIAAPTTTSFANGTGYLIRMPNEDPSNLGIGSTYYAGTSTLTHNGEFAGVPNNGNVNLNGLTSDTYYAVGNPYPSTISAASFLVANNAVGTLYFWRKTNGLGSAYALYNTLGGTAASTTSELPNGTIQVGQGFIVKTGIVATALTFNNAMRISNNANQIFKTKQSGEKNRIWLNLTNTAGTFSQALIGYMADATLGVDNGIDGKYINDSKVALTSIINNDEYTIQGRPTFDASDVVALNFKTDVAGDYTIAIDHVDGVFADGQEVYLVDDKTGTETSLKTSSYTFNAVAGAENSRFSLKYQKSLGTNNPNFNEKAVTVYRNKGTLYVNSGLAVIANVKVYSIQGKLLVELKNVKANAATISNLKAINQVLIVKVTSEDNNVVTKKVVN